MLEFYLVNQMWYQLGENWVLQLVVERVCKLKEVCLGLLMVN